MRIIYITNNYLKGGTGAMNASKCFVNSFAAVAQKMTVLYPIKDGYDATDISKHVELIPVFDYRTKLRKMLDLLYGKLHRFGKETAMYFDASKYDTAVFDSSIASFHLIKKARKAGLKCITIHHNYQVEFVKDDTPWYLLPIMLFWTYFSEKGAVKNSHLNLTLTKTDADSLRMHYDKNGKYEVIGVCDYLHKDYIANNIDRKFGQFFIITGQLSSIQTERSLIPWLEDFFPIMKEEFPDSTLVIAGRSPSYRLINKCKQLGVSIIPSPVDMQPILDAGDYFICPTDLGSGLKLRNMDGLRAGMPILTHEKSVRGYEAMVDAGIMYYYNDKESFRKQLISMVKASNSKQDVLDAYKSYFSLESGIARLNVILQNLQI